MDTSLNQHDSNLMTYTNRIMKCGIKNWSIFLRIQGKKRRHSLSYGEAF